MAPEASTERVVIEMCDTGSVRVWPTASGASRYVLVAGVVSMSFVFVGDQMGTPVSEERRIITPVTAAEPAANVSKYGPNVARTSTKNEVAASRRRTMRRTFAEPAGARQERRDACTSRPARPWPARRP